MKGFNKLAHKITNLFLALFIITAQLFVPISGLAPKVSAANNIDASTHEGQLKPSGTWSTGNITTYQEGDSINFRFALEANQASSGQMKVQFTVDDQFCKFFDGTFVLGSIVNINGVSPVVTTSGTPTDAGSDWEQLLNVNFAGVGKATINYTLKLSNEAGECNGSSQHSRLDDVSGDFKNIGNLNVPVPANQIIELPEIFVEKWVDSDANGVVDRKAAAGEWSFSLDGGTPVPTDANGNVTFTNVTPNGNHIVTESNGPAGQSFLSGSGTNCTFNGSTATASVASGTTSQDATCIFNNGVAPGKIKIIKNAIPNNLTDFAFTATGTGVSGFTLDDDSGVAGADNTFSNEKQFTSLSTGDYVFTESSVSGWDLTDITCSQGANVTKDLANRRVTVHLGAGNDVTCTFENKQRGQIIVTKQTLPDNDPTVFSVTASGSGTIHSTATQNVTDNNSVTYTVAHGTYNVNETVPTGWSVDESACQGLVINGDTPLVNGIPTRSCTITNTKLATIRIIKDALPNHSDNFSFLTSTLPGGNFSLDDDSGAIGEDNTFSNLATFSNLTPNTAYSVSESSLAGWQLTDLDCDTGSFSVNNSQVTITPTPGQTITCTFENTKLRSISGTKYTSDADSGLGPVLSGWTIFIDGNNNGELDSGEASDVTDASGNYSFDNLLPGNYVLKEVLMSGWTQIFGPNPVNLTYNADSTGNNFGNFQNASISGFKWNDKDADDVVDQNENKLDGWTIKLYKDNVEIASTVTSGGGNYSFTNLAPGTYSVCETQQAGWVQTFPDNNACHTIVIDVSAETNQANFGNQGRGTIKVVKNVDTDGNGQVDQQDVNTWTWDINGSGNFATGSGNAQNVAAGTYTVSEDQQTNYHVTASSCSGETPPQSASTSLSATVSPGENVTCTFTNTRDTGTITVNKVVNPTNDSGLFNLQINSQTAGTGANVGHGGSTGAVQVVTGNYSVGETAGTNTSLSDYTTHYSCVNGNQVIIASGDTTTSSNFSVASGDSITCTITNTKKGRIVVDKVTAPTDSPQSFNFSTSGVGYSSFSLTDTDAPNNQQVLPGAYTVSEEAVLGWDSDGGTCDKGETPASLDVGPGETVTCTFTNTQRGGISGTKYEVDADATDGTSGTPLNGWTIFIDLDGEGDLDLGETSDTTDALGAYSFDNLIPGVYTICEVLPNTWTQIFPTSNDGCIDVTLSPGESDNGNDFGNFQNGSISGYKFNDVDGNGADDSEPRLEDWTIFIDLDGEGDLDLGEESTQTAADGTFSFTNLAPGSYSICEVQQTNWVQTTSPTCHLVVIDESNESNTNMIFGNQGQGTITVRKYVDPSDDSGLFNLQIDGQTAGTGADVGHGGGTGTLTYPVGTHSVSETAGTGTDLSDYDSYYNCTVGYQTIANGEGTTVPSFSLGLGDDVVCVFTNVRHGEVTVIKDSQPNDPQDFHFTITEDVDECELILFLVFEDCISFDLESQIQDFNATSEFDLDDDSDETLSNTELTSLSPGFYTITEDTVNGWDLDDIDCGDIQIVGQDENSITIYVGAGDIITCTFTNIKRASVTVTKFNDTNQNGVQDSGEETLSGWEMSLDDTKQLTGQDGSTTFVNVVPNQEYTVSETQQEGWTFSSISCNGVETSVTSREDSDVNIFPVAGETVICKVGNFKPAVLAAVEEVVPLAETGQPGVTNNMYLALSLMTLAVATLLIPSKRNKAIVTISLRRLGQ